MIKFCVFFYIMIITRNTTEFIKNLLDYLCKDGCSEFATRKRTQQKRTQSYKNLIKLISGE